MNLETLLTNRVCVAVLALTACGVIIWLLIGCPT